MKKSFLFIMIAMASLVASAADITKEQFIATGKANAEKKDKAFNEAAYDKIFAKQDLNKDGILSDEEQAAAKAAAQKARAARKAKAAQKKAE